MIPHEGDDPRSDPACLAPPAWEIAKGRVAMTAMSARAESGNGEVVRIRRGRGRPPKIRASYDSYPNERLLATLREAEVIAAQRRLDQLLTEEAELGLHRHAFKTVRRLLKAGRIEALQYYAQLSRYMSLVGLLDPNGGGDRAA
jgi:hypothetical protein